MKITVIAENAINSILKPKTSENKKANCFNRVRNGKQQTEPTQTIDFFMLFNVLLIRSHASEPLNNTTLTKIINQ